ncbi:MAG: hypothetical protein HY282_01995 [Nitrospirae bacterium]|nr:hypothetical protein [Candidatus Manganitrophaceae bacterium]
MNKSTIGVASEAGRVRSVSSEKERALALLALEETVRPLIRLSLRGLERMWLKDRGLFCFTMRDGDRGPRPEGISLRYTAMTLLGLHRVSKSGWTIPFDLEEMLEGAISALPTTRNIGNIGLLLWSGAVLTGRVDPRIAAALERNGSFYQEAGNGIYATTELSWLLIGLIAAAEAASGPERAKFDEMAHLAYRLLRRNLNTETALFAFSTQLSNGWLRPLRSRLGFFDGQVYGIYAFAQYAKRFSDSEALAHAKRCAERICEAQGELGEWAWHYNTLRGRVVDRYPVYAVHQHGMAPLALKGLAAISMEDYHLEIERGLRWLQGENPLRFQFVDEANAVIWRSMRRRRPLSKAIYLNKLVSFVGPTDWLSAFDQSALFKIDRECRPYELGWLLFAFADVPPEERGALGSNG